MKIFYCFLALVCLLPSFNAKAIDSSENDEDRNGADLELTESEIYKIKNGILLKGLANTVRTAVKIADKLWRTNDLVLNQLRESGMAKLVELKERVLEAVTEYIPQVVEIFKKAKRQRFNGDELLDLDALVNGLVELHNGKERYWNVFATHLMSIIQNYLNMMTYNSFHAIKHISDQYGSGVSNKTNAGDNNEIPLGNILSAVHSLSNGKSGNA